MDILKRVWGLQAKWSGQKPYFCISTKRGDSWKDHYFRWPNLGEMEKILREHPTDKYNLYFCPLPLERPYRRKEYVLGSGYLWADIDETDPKKMKHPPHILWESSPGRWAGLWATERWLEVKELEDFNRRMTYGTNSDKAGWDLTQVLRVPGTRNHKYKDSPEGRLVRVDLKSRLSLKEVPKDISRSGEGKALELYKKWEKKLKATTRAILRAPVATENKRSEVLWKLYHQLYDAGLTPEEIKILVRASVWNKYADRRDEEKQLDRDIEKCLKDRLEESGEKRGRAALAGEDGIFEGISMDEVEEKEVDWLWWPYIARGSLTIVEGDPGVGKSYFMQMVGAAICDGGKLPGPGGMGGFEKIKGGSVFYFTVEDDPATVIKPRLGGCKNQHKFRVYPQKLEMDEDGLAVAEYLVERYKTDLVVFDTLNYFVGAIDTHRANEVSQKMEHFQRLAAKHGCAVVVLRHLTKNSTGNVKAAYRGQGSIAFTGSAREVLTVGHHPDEPGTIIVAVTKLNLARFPKAIGYRIEGGDKKDDRSEFVWSECLYELTSDDIIDVKLDKAAGRPAHESEETEKFILEILKAGMVECSKLQNMAEARGISRSTFMRVRKNMGLLTVKKDGKFLYSLK